MAFFFRITLVSLILFFIQISDVFSAITNPTNSSKENVSVVESTDKDSSIDIAISSSVVDPPIVTPIKAKTPVSKRRRNVVVALLLIWLTIRSIKSLFRRRLRGAECHFNSRAKELHQCSTSLREEAKKWYRVAHPHLTGAAFQEPFPEDKEGNMDAVQGLVRHGFKAEARHAVPLSALADSYDSAVSVQARSAFNAIHSLVRSNVPNMDEGFKKFNINRLEPFVLIKEPLLDAIATLKQAGDDSKNGLIEQLQLFCDSSQEFADLIHKSIKLRNEMLEYIRHL